MSGISSVFNRGLDGISIATRGLQAASNNIANVSTEGYARQQIIVNARATSNDGRFPEGQGAEVVGIRSIINPFIEMQLFETANQFGYADGRRTAIQQIESIWNDSQNTGLGKGMSDFFSAVQNLAKKPQDMSLRRALVDSASTLTDQFNNLSQQLLNTRNNLSSEVSSRVTTINELTTTIADLNKNISQAGGPDNAQDLVSQRTLALRKLSTEINISYYTEGDGNVVVAAGGGSTIVRGFEAGTLTLTDDQSSGGTISISGTAPDGSSLGDITSGITGGRLGGNLHERNSNINSQMANLDTLAHQFVTSFNNIHSTGYGLDGTTNHNFFTPLGTSTDAARQISVDAAILVNTPSNNGLNLISCSDVAPSGGTNVGNSVIVDQLVDLRNSRVLGGNAQTFNEYYRDMVGSAGIDAASVQSAYDRQNYLMTQTQVQRESVSGVNMDEEGASIIQFQKSFQASSRIITIANQLMDSILEIVR